jgi:outer membrane lipoprotein-sorting protein
MLFSNHSCRRLGGVVFSDCLAGPSGLAVCAWAIVLSCALISGADAQGPDANRPANLQGAVPAGGNAAEKPVEEPPTESEREIDLAAEKISKLESVAADLDQSVDMLNQKFTIKGRYLKAPGSRIYLKLSVLGLNDTAGTTLQVCDGDILWDYQQILDGQFYHKYSVKPILERLSNPELDARIRDQIKNQLGFAGPDVLLLGIRKVIKFEQKKEAGELQGKKVWIYRGTWRTRQGLMSADSKQVPMAGMLAPYIPMDAVLYLGQDDSWPYRLFLSGRQQSALVDDRRTGPDGRPIGAKSSIKQQNPTVIDLVYSNVKLNATIKLEEFAFTAPASATVDDSTEQIVKGLDQMIRNQVDRKKAESAKKDGPILEQSIPVAPQPASAPNPNG